METKEGSYEKVVYSFTVLLTLSVLVSGLNIYSERGKIYSGEKAHKKEDILSVIEKEGHKIFEEIIRSNNMAGDLGHIPRHGAISQYTVFAPHDSAFEKFSEEKLEMIKSGKGLSKSIAGNHIVFERGRKPLKVSDSEFYDGVENEAGNEIIVQTVHGNIWLELESGKKVGLNSKFGKDAMNGVMYPVSGLLLPEDE